MPSSAPARFSARDLAGPTLIFVAAFLLAVTVAGPLLLAGKFAKVSMDTDSSTLSVSQGPARFLDSCAHDAPVATVHELPVAAGQRVVAVRPADAERVTLQAGTSVRAADDESIPGCDDSTITALTDRVTLDRRSAAPIDNPASQVQYDSRRPPVSLPDRSGFTYVLPHDVAAAGPLSYYDVVARKSLPLTAAGEANVSGLDALRYRAVVGDTDLSALRGADGRPEPGTLIARPASWFGGFPGVAPATELTAALHYRSTWILAVDPKTGVIVDTRREVSEEYRIVGPGDNRALATYRLPKLDATLVYDDDSRRAMADVARAQARPQALWGRTVPAVIAVLGVLALVAGIIILRRNGFGGSDDAHNHSIAE